MVTCLVPQNNNSPHTQITPNNKHQHELTLRLVLGELRVHLLDALDVDAGRLAVVHHGQRVVAAHHAARRLLHLVRRRPRLVDVAGWDVLEDWDVASVGGGWLVGGGVVGGYLIMDFDNRGNIIVCSILRKKTYKCSKFHALCAN